MTTFHKSEGDPSLALGMTMWVCDIEERSGDSHTTFLFDIFLRIATSFLSVTLQNPVILSVSEGTPGILQEIVIWLGVQKRMK
jgi:hypothetical protein